MKRRNVSLKLTPEHDERLPAPARRRATSKSSVIRRAVARYLAYSRDGAAVGSFTALADDLRGVVEGPEDPSSNAGHLEGYGRCMHGRRVVPTRLPPA